MKADMCTTIHPFWKCICIRNTGHSGMHWFQVRWGEGECSLCHERSDDLTDKGICADCNERLIEQAFPR